MAGIRVKRRVTGAAGAPADLLSGEIAYNMVDGQLYIGYGDDGSGNATSVKVFANDSFTGGGSSYTAGNGISITGSAIAVDPTTVVGTFSATNIPNLDAAKIASGTIDPARLPVLPSSVQIVSTGGIAALDSTQQAAIGDGSIVTTTDGRRWIYTGSGSKTSEASYIEMADVTPDWSVIANKPSFATVATSGAYADLTGTPSLATVATSGAYADLTGKPSLGTMASQNANAVAITGGTISGATIDGGTF